MDLRHDTTIEAVLEQLIATGATDPGRIFGQLFELALQIERERFLKANHYERTPERQGYANGYKPKRIDTPAGTVTLQVPKTAGHAGDPFHPQSLERGSDLRVPSCWRWRRCTSRVSRRVRPKR